MDKEYLDRQAYVINSDKDGYYLSDGNGLILEKEELLDIGKNLIKFAKKHDLDIIEHNNFTRLHMYDWLKDLDKKPKQKTKSKIYIMECAGKYKIGMSKDIERRCKQLNNRPCEVNIIYKSDFIEDAFEAEQILHSIYKEKRIGGEWYNLDDKDILTIIKYIEEAL